MEGFTKAMAIELAPHNIRVNSLGPTFLETPMTKPFFENKAFRDEVLWQDQARAARTARRAHRRDRVPGLRCVVADDRLGAGARRRLDRGIAQNSFFNTCGLRQLTGGLPSISAMVLSTTTLRHAFAQLEHRAAEMRRQHHVRHLHELRRHLGLVLVDVEARARDLLVLQRPHQRRLVDHRPARGVDDEGRGLHQRELPVAHQVPRLRR